MQVPEIKMIVKKEKILSGDCEQLKVLLNVHFIEHGEDATKDINRDQRLEIANAIHAGLLISINESKITFETLVKVIEEKFPIVTNKFKADLAFTLKVLDGYVTHSHLDKQLNLYLEKLRVVMLAQSIVDACFWIKPHPLKLIVDFLYEEMIGWQDGFGRNSDELKALFVSAIEEVSAIPLLDVNAYVNFNVLLNENFTRKNHNFNTLSTRLKNSETGLLKAKMSQYTVIDFVNGITKGRKLPPMVANFLLEQLATELRLLLVKDGLNSALWLRWKKILETIVKLYHQGKVDENDAANKTLLHHISDELTQLINESMPQVAIFEDFINQIAFDFTQFALGKEVEGLNHCKQIELPGMLQGIDKQVSQSLLKKVKNINEGQWFLFKEEGATESKRCRLLLRLPDFDQLLLSNFVGQKVLATNYENFAYLLSSKAIQPIFQSSMTSRAVSLTLDVLLKNFVELQEAAKSQAKRKVLEKKQAEQKRKEEQIEKTRQESAAKAKAEAEAIAIRKAAEAAAKAEEEAAAEQAILLARVADDMRRQARLTIDSLALGTWIEMQDPQTKAYGRIKLAVKFNATGRFVFVDADGATVADINRDELVSMVLVKKIKLLESDAYFADRLAKIVTTIRSSK